MRLCWELVQQTPIQQKGLKLKINGNVGINEDNPQTKLNVRGCISTGRNVAREVGQIIDISSSYSGSRKWSECN